MSTRRTRIAPEVAHHRSIVGGLIRQGADPEKIEAARAELRRANLEDHVQKILATMPPLTDAERLHLTRLISS